MRRVLLTLWLLLAAPAWLLLVPADATVSTTAPRNDYVGTSSTATYSYTFKIFAATDLRVTSRNTSNIETTLAYPTDYTVTGVGKAAGGTIVLTAGNLTTGYALTIRFDRTPRQSTDLRNQGSFFPETHETKFDELTRYAQQNKDALDRSLHLPETEVGTSVATTIPVTASRASKYLAFDASGNPTVMAGTSETPNVLLKTGGNLTGGINEAKTTIASSATPDIFATTVGHTINYTGTVAATGFVAAPQAGASRVLVCAGAAPFTAGASMLITGVASGSTYTCEANDEVTVLAFTTTEFHLSIKKADGTASMLDLASAQNFRLSLTTGVPVTTSDVTAAGNLYAVPYQGTRIGLYNGTKWKVRTSAQFSLALTLTSGKPYDIFAYDNAGVPTLEVLVWTNDTTRATALAYQDGILVKSGDATRRYMGSLYASGANVTEDSYAKRYLWNYYHRKMRPMKIRETTASWTYATQTFRQANAAAANQLDYIVGVSEDAVSAIVLANFENDTQAHGGKVGIGIDSTTVNSATLTGVGSVATTVANIVMSAQALYRDFPGVGRHTLVWLEVGTGSGTQVWMGNTDTGSGASIPAQSGIVGEVWG